MPLFTFVLGVGIGAGGMALRPGPAPNIQPPQPVAFVPPPPAKPVAPPPAPAEATPPPEPPRPKPKPWVPSPGDECVLTIPAATCFKADDEDHYALALNEPAFHEQLKYAVARDVKGLEDLIYGKRAAWAVRQSRDVKVIAVYESRRVAEVRWPGLLSGPGFDDSWKFSRCRKFVDQEVVVAIDWLSRKQ